MQFSTQLASCTVGDIACNVYRVVHQTASEITYQLHFTELPTGKHQTLLAESENDAIYLFAAWLVLDEPDIGSSVRRLRSKLDFDFLP